MFQNILSKVGGESKLSSLNHTLGKVKNNLILESGIYIDNLKKDASIVGELVKGETEKLNENLVHGKVLLQKLVTNEDEAVPVSTENEYSIIEQFQEFSQVSQNQASKRLSPIAFIDENDISFDDIELVKENFDYFNIDSDSDEDLEQYSVASHTKIGDIFKRSKDLKLRKLKQKMKEDLNKCTINAEIEAESWRSSALEANPLNLFLNNRSRLDKTPLEELKKLSNLLGHKICESNTNLLELIEEKDALEQRNEEADADVKDLMSIM